MNEKEQTALNALKVSKNYADICPDTVERIFLAQLPKYKKLKDADKAARSQLHAITGAFMTQEEISRARAALVRLRAGETEALKELLCCHSSTRERLLQADTLFDRVLSFAAAFSADGTVSEPTAHDRVATVADDGTASEPSDRLRVLDLACGLNPLYLASRGVIVTGIDIHGGCVNLINDCARALSWSANARLGDLVCEIPTEEADLALFMKLLPVLESQKNGAGIRLLSEIHAPKMCVTFPTKTLGGRSVGMEKHYSEWFERALPENIFVRDKFTTSDELVYLLEK